MQTPTQKTKVSKCVDLGTYASQMMAKFPQTAELVMLSQKLGDATQKLKAAQDAYLLGVGAILPTRVEVTFQNFVSDNRVRQTLRKAELFDGRANGPASSMVFPNGVTPIIKPVGATQVKEMRDMEGRLEAAGAIWPEALSEKAEIGTFRDNYEKALEARRAAGQTASDLRAVRNAVKEDFLMVYVTSANRVKALFPRDRVMQDLFFDEVRSRSVSEDADSDANDDDESADQG